MSLPPQVIHVKRKRDADDAPVTFLRVEERVKRHRADAFVYKRKASEQAPGLGGGASLRLEPRLPPSVFPSAPSAAAISQTLPHRTPPASTASKQSAPPPIPAPGGNVASSRTPTPDDARQTELEEELRRYRISRRAVAGGGGGSFGRGGRGGAGAQHEHQLGDRYGAGGKRTALVFEKVVKKGSPPRRRRRTPRGSAEPEDTKDEETTKPLAATATAAAVPEGRRLKRPGLANRSVSAMSSSGGGGPAAKRDPGGATDGEAPPGGAGEPAPPPANNNSGDLVVRAKLPQSMLHRDYGDMDRLAADMSAYTLEQIGLNLARMNEERGGKDGPAAASASPSLSSAAPGHLAAPAALTRANPSPRFKPKAPAKRFAERNPAPAEAEAEAGGEGEEEGQEGQEGQSDTDEDGDYVIDTYIRMPAQALDHTVPAREIGLLVFENEPEVEYFYGNEEDSEEEWAEDDDDENAEGHYTADYPDDEVESGDEYDRDPYSYRTGNASDDEEFDFGRDDYDAAEIRREKYRAWVSSGLDTV